MSDPVVHLQPLDGTYVVVRLDADAPVPPDLVAATAAGSFVSTTRTPRELSIVCPADLAPAGAQIDGPWVAFYTAGQIAFDLTGVVASLVSPLSAADCPVFVTSTFDGDILMVPAARADEALELLAAAGHVVGETPRPSADSDSALVSQLGTHEGADIEFEPERLDLTARTPDL